MKSQYLESQIKLFQILFDFNNGLKSFFHQLSSHNDK